MTEDPVGAQDRELAEARAEGYRAAMKDIAEATERVRDFEEAISRIEELLGVTKSELLSYRQDLARLGDVSRRSST